MKTRQPLVPGTITRGLIEYIFVCFDCQWRESISANNKADAIRTAKQFALWKLRDGKWYCPAHSITHPAGIPGTAVTR